MRDAKESITEPAKDIVCILAPNPSPMTFKGTNTYVIGYDELAIIDPGPLNEEHFINILEVTAERPVKYIFITHSHLDHSPLSKKLSEELNTPIYGYGAPYAGLSSTMLSLIRSGYESDSEGIDYEFNPDILIKNNQMILEYSFCNILNFSIGNFTQNIKIYFKYTIRMSCCCINVYKSC